MVGGFNHNVVYRGAVYHVQTEDKGRKTPSIQTLLYRGGTIVASRAVSYADIIRVDNLKALIEELMKDQHKAVLRSLKNGEFDQAIERLERRESSARPSADAAKIAGTDPAKSPGSAAPDQREDTVGVDLEQIVFTYLAGEGR